MAILWIGLTIALFLFFAMMFLVYEAPIDPPVIVIKRRFGEIIYAERRSGWIGVIPYIHSIETIELKRFSIEVKPSEVLTPDDVSLSISVALHLSLIPEKEAVMKFLESGKIDGVTKFLKEITGQEIRQWARDPNNPPRTWQDAQSSQDELTAVLFEKIIKECGKSNGENSENAKGSKNKGLLALVLRSWLTKLSKKPDHTDSQTDPKTAEPGTEVKLPKFGVFLERVVIGAISPLDDNLRKEKEGVAREKLQRATELADTKTKLELAASIAEKCEIPLEKALKFIADNELIKSGHGNVFRLEASEELLTTARKLLGRGGEQS